MNTCHEIALRNLKKKVNIQNNYDGLLSSQSATIY